MWIRRILLKNGGEIFEGLSIWKEEKYQNLQEAYVNGFWKELVSFIRSMFNSTFKTNPYMERAIMTGITRVSKESIFFDLNNLKVITTTSEEYATVFGFTEGEVFAAMDEMGRSEKDKVKKWYDGFVFGNVSDIYSLWSIINLLDTGKFTTYWANTSSNGLIGKLLRERNKGIKEKFETLMQGGVIESKLDEQIVHDREDETSLADTVAAALDQMEEKQYARILIDQGIALEHIRKYGFAFEGKKVLIG